MKSAVPMNVSADELMVRRAARRMAWQIAAVSAIVVLVAVLATLVIGPLVHHHGQDLEQVTFGPDHDDDVLRTTLLIAGGIGIVIAALAGFVLARRTVAPIGAALALQRRFVADAGHELRTPITVLHTRAQLISRRMDPDDPARPAVDQLLDDSRVLGDIVDELLASAQLSADPRHGEIFAVTEVADAAVSSLSALGDGRDIHLSRTGTSSEVLIRGSRAALRRAITALVDNALEHTGKGGHITVDVSAGETTTTVSVSDDGEGLGDGEPSQLVERFARGPGAPVGTRRFGLGLSLVREIAVAHGGTFRIEPGPVRGTRAAIDLPIARIQ